MPRPNQEFQTVCSGGGPPECPAPPSRRPFLPRQYPPERLRPRPGRTPERSNHSLLESPAPALRRVLRRPPAMGAGSAWGGIPTTSRVLSTAMTAVITPTFSTCPVSLAPPGNPRSWNCRIGRPGTRNGSAHAASRSISLRRSCSASREATTVPATLVSRARSSRGISRWSANTMRESNSSP